MDALGAIALMLFVVAGIPLLFLPSILAFSKSHDRRWLILTVNILLGAAGIGWVIAWVFYFLPNPHLQTALEPSGSADAQCPSCLRYYDPADYRDDALQIRCSYCGAEIHRAGVQAAV